MQKLYSLLTSALEGVEWSTPHHGRYTRRQWPVTICTEWLYNNYQLDAL